VSLLLAAGRGGHAGQLAAAALVAAMVEDGHAQVGRQAALAIAKDPNALAAVFALLPGHPDSPADAAAPGAAASTVRTGATKAPAAAAAAAVPGFAARCLALGGSILRDVALHESCRDQLSKRCASGSTAAAEDAPLAATFRFGKDDKANADAKLKKVRASSVRARAFRSVCASVNPR
jgi:hypothetical protein